ncbi:hypothetical protein [Streptomyces sp. NPDC090056]|uniref:hypothetical protein n=1 Tax=Streptomyces sp. NPDC090056 TaxID=3365934 RepID=UPI003800B919
MKGPYKDRLRLEGDIAQWAGYGVNVGQTLYGGVHFHPFVPAVGPYRRRTTSPVSAAQHAAVLSALSALASACERAATALTLIGSDGPERTSDDDD